MGLQEHYKACRIVMEKYPDRIPNRKKLKRKVATAFAMRTASKGVKLLLHRKYTDALTYLKLSREFDPAIAFRKALLPTVISMVRQNIRTVAT